MKTRTVVAAALLAAFAAVAVRSAETPKGVAAEDASGADSGKLIKGYRAITIPVSGDQVAFLKKGDRVDLLVTFDANMKDGKEKVTATILQNVVVSHLRNPMKIEDKGAVEIIVNPNEAQYTSLALHQGEVHISKRADGDTEMHPMEMASFRKLFQ